MYAVLTPEQHKVTLEPHQSYTGVTLEQYMCSSVSFWHCSGVAINITNKNIALNTFGTTQSDTGATPEQHQSDTGVTYKCINNKIK